MRKTALFTAATVVGLVASQAAFASDDVLPSSDSTFRAWGEESGWNILVDEGRNSCLIERMYENGGVIQMGLTKDHEFGYFGVFTKNAEVKNKEDIVLSLGDNLYSAKARGKTKNLADGYVGGYLLTNNPNFVEDVMRQREMLVFPKETYAWLVSLDGTMKAIEAARKCNMEVGG
ncbi:hypothetical protein R3X27_16655 [Tropicimonas sp. TH_r6]|uniref:hypothetical protein n=1 Tax=Tropicimonas sp. TH_r6 TaxID=3082085 RepID=UPI0029537FD8|nr:hypothetical protein [Tropicimonas sp. TH_r6]MDV7144314.1 hypothetical protein [Tropicimonas sp. TH_r6]